MARASTRWHLDPSTWAKKRLGSIRKQDLGRKIRDIPTGFFQGRRKVHPLLAIVDACKEEGIKIPFDKCGPGVAPSVLRNSVIISI